MRDDEIDALLPRMKANYVAAMIDDGGFPSDVAEAKATADGAALFPDGRPTPDQALFAIENDDEAVGRLWIAERPEALHHGALWILELYIDESHRGHCYGRGALMYAQGEAVRRARGRVALNLFGGNEAARTLYDSFGYREHAV